MNCPIFFRAACLSIGWVLGTAAVASASVPMPSSPPTLKLGDETYRQLENINPGDADFVLALTELQKIHFRAQDWQRFFGYAAFYRHNLLLREFNPRLVALELLALAKLCRWADARALSQAALGYAKEKGLDTAEIRSASKQVELARAFPHAIEGAADLRGPAPVFSRELYWKLSSSELSKVPHPRNLRLKVESQCGS